MDPYKILGIEKDASPDEIRRAYRKQALKYHPDKGGDVWVFQQIQAAYDELTGKKKKQKPKKKPESAQPKQEPQPEPTKPFTEKPFGDEPFEFNFEKEEPRPKTDYWQTYSAKTGPTGNRKKPLSARWLMGSGVGVLCIGILTLVVWIGRSSTRATAESAEQEVQPTSELSTQSINTRSQPRVVNPSMEQDDAPSEVAKLPANSSASESESFLPAPILSFSFDGLQSTRNTLETTGTTTALGKVGNALVFSSDSFAKVSLPGDSSIGAIAFWAKANRLDKFFNYHIVTHGELGSKNSFGIMIGQNKWRILHQSNDLNSWEEVDQDWHHHCVTKNGKEIIYYVDGIALAQGQLDFAFVTETLFLGNPGPTYPRGFDGCIDEFVIFSQTLNKDQVNLLVSLGREGMHWSEFASVKLPSRDSNAVGTDSQSFEPATNTLATERLAEIPIMSLTFDPEGSTNHATQLKKNNSFEATGRVGNCLRFYDENSYATSNASFPSGNASRTLAVWLKSNRKYFSENVLAVAFGQPKPKEAFGIMVEKNRWRFFDWNGGLDSTIVIDADWHHHCITHDGTTIRYYFDGDLVAQVDRKLETKQGPLFIGVLEKGFSPSFTGQVDELLVYSTSLSSDKVKAVFALGKENRHGIESRRDNGLPQRTPLKTQSTSDIDEKPSIQPRVQPKSEVNPSIKIGVYSLKTSRLDAKGDPEKIALKFYENGTLRWDWRVSGTWRLSGGRLLLDLPDSSIRIEVTRLSSAGFHGRVWYENVAYNFEATLEK